MALERLLDLTRDTPIAEHLYEYIDFPEATADRPYLYINMVSTVDGKIVIGEVGGPARGVGGPTDQLLFRRLQHTCDAVMIGAGTLRASQVIYPPELPRYVVTQRGDLPLTNRFFTDAPDRAWVIAPSHLPSETRKMLESKAHLIQSGSDEVDLTETLRVLRQEHRIKRLLCEGGPSLNDDLIRASLADELFLTISPKLKGGAQLPTVMEGAGFPPGRYLPLSLLSLYRDGDELYFRYRMQAKPVLNQS